MSEPVDGLLRKAIRDHGPAIYRFSYRLCGNETIAEDLTQEVFLAAFEGLARFREQSSLKNWLYKIAIYRWHAMKKSHRQIGDGADLLERRLPDVNPESDLKIDFERAFTRLSPKLQQAFLLVKIEGFTCREAAGILSVPTGTMKHRVFQAVAQLQKLLLDWPPNSRLDVDRPLVADNTRPKNLNEERENLI